MYKYIFSLFSIFWATSSLAHGISEEAKQSMIGGGYFQYVWLGAEHMLTGYDHLLFLFGVIFFLTTFKDVVKFVSVFTLGHSITLILATFMGVTANYWLIDAVIALSVCYKGFDNNDGFQKYFGMKKAPNLLVMVFVFGLIHGFGLSTRLQQLPLGEKGTEMLMRIISFNVGVEFGQIIALGAMLILLSGFRKAEVFKRFSRVANDALILAGFMLLLMQLHGYLHTSDPDGFGFGEDNHIHHHMEMAEPESHSDDPHDHSPKPEDPCVGFGTKDLEKSSVTIGKCHILRFIDAEKIDPSWQSAKHIESLIKTFEGNKEWLVTFGNPKGVQGKILYIFLDLNGGFIAGNFIGE